VGKCVMCSGTVTNLHSQVCPSCDREETSMRANYNLERAKAPDLAAVMSTAEAELRKAAAANRGQGHSIEIALRSLRKQATALDDAQSRWSFLLVFSKKRKAYRLKKVDFDTRIAHDEARLEEVAEYKRRVATQIRELER
jgi:hypothetical protein